MYNIVRFRKNVCEPIGQTEIIDFDGNGMTDRAFWNPSNGSWRYYTGTNQDQQVYFQWGLGSLGDEPVANDYDGDGITDYAIYRKPEGRWWVYRSSDQKASVTSFGLPDDIPVPTDYDADGKADIAVFRNGVWYVLRSDYSSTIFYWGIENDNVFLGRNLFEPAAFVYRKTSVTIYTNRFMEVYNGLYEVYNTGSSFNERFVSSVLPAQ